jgi:hypothetical protein
MKKITTTLVAVCFIITACAKSPSPSRTAVLNSLTTTTSAPVPDKIKIFDSIYIFLLKHAPPTEGDKIKGKSIVALGITIFVVFALYDFLYELYKKKRQEKRQHTK